MTTTAKKPDRKAKPAKRIRKSANPNAEMKPFSIVNGKYVFWFEPAPEGGFSVSCQNIPGVNAEGDTFEDALADAMKCVVFVEKCLAEIVEEQAGKGRRVASASKKAAARTHGRK